MQSAYIRLKSIEKVECYNDVTKGKVIPFIGSISFPLYN